MFRIEYFDNFELYCFDKYDTVSQISIFSQSVISLMKSYKFKCKM